MQATGDTNEEKKSDLNKPDNKARIKQILFMGCFIAVFITHTFWWMVIMLPCLIIRYYSVPIYRSIESHLFACLSYLYCFALEKFGNVEIIFSGDELPKENDSLFIMSNHLSDADGGLIMLMAMRCDSSYKVRMLMKQIIKYVFPIGPVLAMHECLFMKRSFESDSSMIDAKLTTFHHYNTPLWLAIFPEGTYITPQRISTLKENQEFASSRGLPVFNNVLTPRTKGVSLILKKDSPSHLRQHLTAVYDVTLAYGEPFSVRLGEKNMPTSLSHVMGNLWARNPSNLNKDSRVKIHYHLRRFPIESVPEDVHSWVMTLFQDKENLLDHFHNNKSFPGPQRESPMSSSDWSSRLFRSIVPPFFALFTAISIFVNYKGGIIASIPSLMLALLILIILTSAVLIFVMKQGGKKPSEKKREKNKIAFIAFITFLYIFIIHNTQHTTRI